QATGAKLLTCDEARRIAANFAKLSDLLRVLTPGAAPVPPLRFAVFSHLKSLQKQLVAAKRKGNCAVHSDQRYRSRVFNKHGRRMRRRDIALSTVGGPPCGRSWNTKGKPPSVVS